ncbi:MAG TPA: glycosyltransferase family 39 protein [Thermoanaerobaculia bacterium]|nr:glycosyltransferase family 39 protein [Thermoanaerobaculia bacterium]
MSRRLPTLSTGRIAVAGAVLLAAVLLVLAPASVVFALVFLGALLYAVHTGRRHALSPDGTVRAAVFLVTAAGLALPALLGLITTSSQTLDSLLQPNAAFRKDLALLALVVVGTVAAARFWPARFQDRSFVLLMVTLAVLAKIAYVSVVQAEPVSDFASMWRLSSSLLEEGLEATRSGLEGNRWAHFERILPFLFPVRTAFGPGPAAYAVPNVLLAAATSLLTYRLARRWFGRTAARVALVLSLLAVETTIIAEIPTHEIPGAFYTLLALTLFQIAWDLQAQGRSRAALLVGAAFGLSILVLDFQRSTGSVMLLSTTLLGLGLAVAGEPSQEGERPEGGKRWTRLRRGLPLVLVPVLAFALANAGVRGADLRTPPEERAKGAGIGLASATDSAGDGSYVYYANNYLWRYGLSGVNWQRLALVKLASDTHYHPGARLIHYLRKARALFTLGTQTYFYLYEAKFLEGPIDPVAGRIYALCVGFTSLFLAALLVALARIWDLPALRLPTLAPLFFLATFSAVLLLLAEIQPRYMFPIWYIGAIYIGALFGRSA